MLWARAASRIFLTLGTLAWQRGRTPQLAFMKSSRSNAVVLGSTVTGLSSGAGGVFTVAQSATMSPARAGCAAAIAATATAAQASLRAKFVMVSSPRCVPALLGDLPTLAWVGNVYSAVSPLNSGSHSGHAHSASGVSGERSETRNPERHVILKCKTRMPLRRHPGLHLKLRAQQATNCD